MALHIDLGKKGEALAEEFLLQKGFTILHRNWRHSHYEIDIVAIKNNLLHIIEVKTLSSRHRPEGNVTRKKLNYLLQAADQFLYKHPEYKHIQIDILAINLFKSGEPEYFYIQDVYL